MAPVAVAEAKHEEVAELVLLVLDSTEGRADPQLVAELGPLAEDLVLGMAVFDGGAFGADLQSSTEVSSEAASGVKWSSFQGASCGQCWSKWARKVVLERCCRWEASFS